MYRHRIATRHTDIALEPQSLTDWLVLKTDHNREHTQSGAHPVIGHIQLFLGVYEVLSKDAPLERGFYDSLDSAVDSFAPCDLSAEPSAEVIPITSAVGSASGPGQAA